MINTDESHMKAEHAKELESLRTKLHSAQIKNREVKSKLVSMGKSREALQSSLRQLEEDFDSISIKFDDAVAKKERKERQHQEILAELSRQTDQSLETIRCRQEECKLEIDRTKEAIASESRYLIPRMYCHNLVHLIQRMSSLS
jgi:chromosome segregation ATPase